MLRNRNSSGASGCGVSGIGCMLIMLAHLLIGSTAAKYCLLHWIPALQSNFPTITPLDPNISVWSLPLILLGVFGAELFIPGAIITWLLIVLGIVH